MPRNVNRKIAVGIAAVLISPFGFMTNGAFAGTISSVTAVPNSLVAGNAATYTIDFTTSATGALVSGVGTITLTAPLGTQLPLFANDYSVNGVTTTIAPTDSAADNVSITTPITVNPSTVVQDSRIGLHQRLHSR